MDQQKPTTKSRYSRVLRGISLLLVVTFSWQDLALSAPLENISRLGSWDALDPAKIQFSGSFAKVSDVYKGSDSKLLIHIQDAHTNTSGQKNLSQALEELIKRHDIQTVFIEGGTKDDSLDFLRPLASPEVRERVAKKYLMQGELNGAEYLSLASDHDFKILGVEEAKLYDQNLRTYAAVVSHREAVLSYIGTMTQRVQSLKQKLYPKDILKFDDFLALYRKKEKSFTEYYDTLSLAAGERSVNLLGFPHFLSLKDLKTQEEKIDFKKANTQQQALVSALSEKDFVAQAQKLKSGNLSPLPLYDSILRQAQANKIDLSSYPDFVAYVDYLRSFAKIKMERLLRETEILEEIIYQRGLEDDEIFYLHRLDGYLAILKSLFSLQATPRDYDEYSLLQKDRRFSTSVCLAFINRKLYDLGRYADVIPTQAILDESKKEIEDFYRTAGDRDDVFLKKSLETMDQNKISRAVLITGGFHTPSLKQKMKEKNISYAVVTPAITEETNIERYEDLLLSQLPDIESKKTYTSSVKGEPNFIILKMIRERLLGVEEGMLALHKVVFEMTQSREVADEIVQQALKDLKAGGFGGTTPGDGGQGGRPIVIPTAKHLSGKRIGKYSARQSPTGLAKATPGARLAGRKNDRSQLDPVAAKGILGAAFGGQNYVDIERDILSGALDNLTKVERYLSSLEDADREYELIRLLVIYAELANLPQMDQNEKMAWAFRYAITETERSELIRIRDELRGNPNRTNVQSESDLINGILNRAAGNYLRFYDMLPSEIKRELGDMPNSEITPHLENIRSFVSFSAAARLAVRSQGSGWAQFVRRVFLAITFVLSSNISVLADTVRFAFDKARTAVTVLVNGQPQSLDKRVGVNFQPTEPGRHITFYTEGKMRELAATLLPPSDPVLKELGLTRRGLSYGQKLTAAGIYNIRFHSVPLEDKQDIEAFKKILRRAHQLYGIQVAVGHWAGLWSQPGSPELSADTPEARLKVIQSVMGMVKTYASEPWVKYWILGNENNYHAKGGPFIWKTLPLRAPEYYEFMTQLAVATKWQERQINTATKPTYHPVVLGHGSLTESQAETIKEANEKGAKDLDGEKPWDAIGATLYPGIDFDSERVGTSGVAEAFTHFHQLAWETAGLSLITTEWGPWAEDANSPTQVQYYSAAKPAFIANHQSAGTFAFSGADEDWKPREAGQQRKTEGEFGLFTADGQPKRFVREGGFKAWNWDTRTPSFEKPASLKPFTKKPLFLTTQKADQPTPVEGPAITIKDFSTWKGGGSFSTYNDLREDLTGFTTIRLYFDASDAGASFKLRLLPASSGFDSSAGLLSTVFTVPKAAKDDEAVTLDISIPPGTGKIKQFSIHTGDVWGRRVSPERNVVPKKIELFKGPKKGGARLTHVSGSRDSYEVVGHNMTVGAAVNELNLIAKTGGRTIVSFKFISPNKPSFVVNSKNLESYKTKQLPHDTLISLTFGARLAARVIEPSMVTSFDQLKRLVRRYPPIRLREDQSGDTYRIHNLEVKVRRAFFGEPYGMLLTLDGGVLPFLRVTPENVKTAGEVFRLLESRTSPTLLERLSKNIVPPLTKQLVQWTPLLDEEILFHRDYSVLTGGHDVEGARKRLFALLNPGQEYSPNFRVSTSRVDRSGQAHVVELYLKDLNPNEVNQQLRLHSLKDAVLSIVWAPGKLLLNLANNLTGGYLLEPISFFVRLADQGRISQGGSEGLAKGARLAVDDLIQKDAWDAGDLQSLITEADLVELGNGFLRGDERYFEGNFKVTAKDYIFSINSINPFGESKNLFTFTITLTDPNKTWTLVDGENGITKEMLEAILGALEKKANSKPAARLATLEDTEKPTQFIVKGESIKLLQAAALMTTMLAKKNSPLDGWSLRFQNQQGKPTTVPLNNLNGYGDTPLEVDSVLELVRTNVPAGFLRIQNNTNPRVPFVVSGDPDEVIRWVIGLRISAPDTLIYAPRIGMSPMFFDAPSRPLGEIRRTDTVFVDENGFLHLIADAQNEEWKPILIGYKRVDVSDLPTTAIPDDRGARLSSITKDMVISYGKERQEPTTVKVTVKIELLTAVAAPPKFELFYRVSGLEDFLSLGTIENPSPADMGELLSQFEGTRFNPSSLPTLEEKIAKMMRDFKVAVNSGARLALTSDLENAATLASANLFSEFTFNVPGQGSFTISEKGANLMELSMDKTADLPARALIKRHETGPVGSFLMAPFSGRQERYLKKTVSGREVTIDLGKLPGAAPWKPAGHVGDEPYVLHGFLRNARWTLEPGSTDSSATFSVKNRDIPVSITDVDGTAIPEIKTLADIFGDLQYQVTYQWADGKFGILPSVTNLGTTEATTELNHHLTLDLADSDAGLSEWSAQIDAVKYRRMNDNKMPKRSPLARVRSGGEYDFREPVALDRPIEVGLAALEDTDGIVEGRFIHKGGETISLSWDAATFPQTLLWAPVGLRGFEGRAGFQPKSSSPGAAGLEKAGIKDANLLHLKPNQTITGKIEIGRALVTVAAARLSSASDSEPEIPSLDDQIEAWKKNHATAHAVSRILVNEDENIPRMLLEFVTKNVLGLEPKEDSDKVILALKSEDAWDAFQSGSFDFIVTDINTKSDINGIDLIRHIREQEARDQVQQPVMILVQSSTLKPAMKGLDLKEFGPDTFYVEKPAGDAIQKLFAADVVSAVTFEAKDVSIGQVNEVIDQAIGAAIKYADKKQMTAIRVNFNGNEIGRHTRPFNKQILSSSVINHISDHVRSTREVSIYDIHTENATVVITSKPESERTPKPKEVRPDLWTRISRFASKLWKSAGARLVDKKTLVRWTSLLDNEPLFHRYSSVWKAHDDLEGARQRLFSLLKPGEEYDPNLRVTLTPLTSPNAAISNAHRLRSLTPIELNREIRLHSSKDLALSILLAPGKFFLNLIDRLMDMLSPDQLSILMTTKQRYSEGDAVLVQVRVLEQSIIPKETYIAWLSDYGTGWIQGRVGEVKSNGRVRIFFGPLDNDKAPNLELDGSSQSLQKAPRNARGARLATTSYVTDPGRLNQFSTENYKFTEVNPDFLEALETRGVSTKDLKWIQRLIGITDPDLKEAITSSKGKVSIAKEEILSSPGKELKFRPSEGRNIYLKLEKPVGDVRYLMIKGGRPKRGRAGEVPVYRGLGHAKRSIGIDYETADFVLGVEARSPIGAMPGRTVEIASEVLKGDGVERGFITDKYFAKGVYPKLSVAGSPGEAVAFMIIGLRERDHRLSTIDMFDNMDDEKKGLVTYAVRREKSSGSIHPLDSKNGDITEYESRHRTFSDERENVVYSRSRWFFEDLGKAVRAYHDEGYFHQFLHSGNIGIEKSLDGEFYPVLRDLDTTLKRSVFSGRKNAAEIEASYRFADISRIIYGLTHDLASREVHEYFEGDTYDFEPQIDHLVRSFYLGYFGVEKPIADEFGRNLESNILFSIARLVGKVANQTPVDRLRLKEDPQLGKLWSLLKNMAEAHTVQQGFMEVEFQEFVGELLLPAPKLVQAARLSLKMSKADRLATQHVLEEIIAHADNKFGTKGPLVIVIDGPSGVGKSTYAQMLAGILKRRKRSVADVINLDWWMNHSEVRNAIEGVIRRNGKSVRTEYQYAWREESLDAFLKEVTSYLFGKGKKPAILKKRLVDTWDRTQRKFVDRDYQVGAKDVVIIEGKYALKSRFLRDRKANILRVRIDADIEKVLEQFALRVQSLAKDGDAIKHLIGKMTIYQLVYGPSWEAYHKTTTRNADVDIIVHHDRNPKSIAILNADAARLAVQNKIQDEIRQFQTTINTVLSKSTSSQGRQGLRGRQWPPAPEVVFTPTTADLSASGGVLSESYRVRAGQKPLFQIQINPSQLNPQALVGVLEHELSRRGNLLPIINNLKWINAKRVFVNRVDDLQWSDDFKEAAQRLRQVYSGNSQNQRVSDNLFHFDEALKRFRSVPEFSVLKIPPRSWNGRRTIYIVRYVEKNGSNPIFRSLEFDDSTQDSGHFILRSFVKGEPEIVPTASSVFPRSTAEHGPYAALRELLDDPQKRKVEDLPKPSLSPLEFQTLWSTIAGASEGKPTQIIRTTSAEEVGGLNHYQVKKQGPDRPWATAWEIFHYPGDVGGRVRIHEKGIDGNDTHVYEMKGTGATKAEFDDLISLLELGNQVSGGEFHLVSRVLLAGEYPFDVYGSKEGKTVLVALPAKSKDISLEAHLLGPSRVLAIPSDRIAEIGLQESAYDLSRDRYVRLKILVDGKGIPPQGSYSPIVKVHTFTAQGPILTGYFKGKGEQGYTRFILGDGTTVKLNNLDHLAVVGGTEGAFFKSITASLGSNTHDFKRFNQALGASDQIIPIFGFQGSPRTAAARLSADFDEQMDALEIIPRRITHVLINEAFDLNRPHFVRAIQSNFPDAILVVTTTPADAETALKDLFTQSKVSPGQLLVITDVNPYSPSGNGYDVIRSLRALENERGPVDPDQRNLAMITSVNFNETAIIAEQNSRKDLFALYVAKGKTPQLIDALKTRLSPTTAARLATVKTPLTGLQHRSIFKVGKNRFKIESVSDNGITFKLNGKDGVAKINTVIQLGGKEAENKATIRILSIKDGLVDIEVDAPAEKIVETLLDYETHLIGNGEKENQVKIFVKTSREQHVITLRDQSNAAVATITINAAIIDIAKRDLVLDIVEQLDRVLAGVPITSMTSSQYKEKIEPVFEKLKREPAARLAQEISPRPFNLFGASAEQTEPLDLNLAGARIAAANSNSISVAERLKILILTSFAALSFATFAFAADGPMTTATISTTEPEISYTLTLSPGDLEAVQRGEALDMSHQALRAARAQADTLLEKALPVWSDASFWDGFETALVSTTGDLRNLDLFIPLSVVSSSVDLKKTMGKVVSKLEKLGAQRNIKLTIYLTTNGQDAPFYLAQQIQKINGNLPNLRHAEVRLLASRRGTLAQDAVNTILSRADGEASLLAGRTRAMILAEGSTAEQLSSSLGPVTDLYGKNVSIAGVQMPATEAEAELASYSIANMVLVSAQKALGLDLSILPTGAFGFSIEHLSNLGEVVVFRLLRLDEELTALKLARQAEIAA